MSDNILGFPFSTDGRNPLEENQNLKTEFEQQRQWALQYLWETTVGPKRLCYCDAFTWPHMTGTSKQCKQQGQSRRAVIYIDENGDLA